MDKIDFDYKLLKVKINLIVLKFLLTFQIFKSN